MIGNGQKWDWPENKWRRRKLTVADHIYWSYAWLIATRISQRERRLPRQRKRNELAVPLFGQLSRGEKAITSLERDLFQSMMAEPVCLHCGSRVRLTKDHLIPRSLGGDNDAENIVTSCASCNSSRGNRDLMRWYRDQRQFPCLVLMRQYLKICHKYASAAGLLNIEVMQALRSGLPFDPNALPEKFPSMEDLRYDWRSGTS